MKQGLGCATAAAFIAICCPSIALSKTIRTMSAVYGNPASGKVCDATQVVASMCDGRRQCDVPIGNGSLCNDPDFLVVKQAQIDFKCGGSTRTATAQEYTVVRLASR